MHRILLLFAVLLLGDSRAEGNKLDLPDRPVADRVSYVSRIEANQKRNWAELDGPGCIKHIWLCVDHPKLSVMPNRKMVIRIFFDDAKVPHVEAPIGDFFGVSHGENFYAINTPWLSVKEYSGYNCYFEMPFAKNARIELETGPERNSCYMQVDWHRYPGQEMKEKRRFRASWRKENPTESYGRDFLMLDADGPGQLLGFVYSVRLIDNEDRWSHGGSENIYIDGLGEHPAFIRGIGGEDSFGTSYGGAHHPPETHLFSGMPYYEHEDVWETRRAQRLVGYRFFYPDTVPFYESIHMRFGSMRNNICSTVYWYQEAEPRPYVKLPDWKQLMPDEKVAAADIDLPLPDQGSWWVTGPVETGNAEAMDAAVTKPKDSGSWNKAPSLHGFVDFNHYYRPRKRGAGVHHRGMTSVATCQLEAKEPGEATFRLAWDDHLTLQVNDEPILDLGSHPSFRSKTMTVPLREGKNTVTVSLSNEQGSNHGGWAFAFKATSADGKLLPPQAH